MNRWLARAFLVQIFLIALLALAALVADGTQITVGRIVLLVLIAGLGGWLLCRWPGRWLGPALFALAWMVFPLLKPIRAVWLPWSADALLANVDGFLWGGRILPAWFVFEAHPLLGDILAACYFSFYFQVLAAVGWYAYRNRADFFNRLIGIYFIGISGYFLLPAAGPAFTDMPHGALSGPVSAAVSRIVADGVTGMDVFPSLHTAIAVFVTGYFWCDGKRKTALALAPVTIGIVMATIFMRYHYGIDVIAGLVLAGFFLIGRQR